MDEEPACRKLTPNIHSSHDLNRPEAKRFRVKLTNLNIPKIDLVEVFIDLLEADNLSVAILIPAASSSVGIAAIQLAIFLVAIPAALTRTSAKRQQLCMNRSKTPTVEWFVPYHP
ncbi:MAG: hypothetical protein WA426_08430, partial [Silvibacterium sp.]